MKTKLVYIISLLFLTLHSCKKDAIPEPTDYPYVILSEINDITSEGATFNANITKLGNQKILDYGFVWNDSASRPTMNSTVKSLGNSPSLGEFSYTVKSDLEIGKTFNVRAYIKTDKVIVYSNIRSFISEGCLPPVIKEFYPDSGSAGRIVTIIGENFSLKISKNIVSFGIHQGVVVKSNRDTILVACPNTTKTVSTNIKIETAGQQTESQSSFKLIYPWLKCKDFIGGSRAFSSSCVYNNMGYTTLGRQTIGDEFLRQLWQFSYDTKVWTQRKDFPGSDRTWGQAFTAGGLVYFGLGENGKSGQRFYDFWGYNPSTDEWEKQLIFPGAYSICSFAINDTVYLISHTSTKAEFWKYYPNSDTWQKQDLISLNQYFDFAFTYKGKGYLMTFNGEIFQYNPMDESFVFIDKMNVYTIQDAFSMNGVIYSFKEEYSDKYSIKSYDLENKYQFTITYPCSSTPETNFAFSDKVYISPRFSFEFWEFYPR